MNEYVSPDVRRGTRAPLLRAAMHALLLAVVALTVTVTGFTPPAATAQVPPPAESPTPSEAPVPPETPVLATPQPLPAEVQLNVGDSVQLDNGGIQIALLQVSEDSRCPMNVMCVWMGRATVWLSVDVDGVHQGEVSVSLYPGRQAAAPTDADAIVGRYVISLVDLQPYPVAGQPHPLDQKTATIRIASSQ